MLWCEIVSFQTKSTFICLFYRPHSTGVEYMESLRDSLTLLKCKYSTGNYELLVVGDFNLPTIDWSNECLIASKSNVVGTFLDVIHDFNLKQHVFDPTRYGTSDNVLDLVFSLNQDFVQNLTVEPGISDHEMVSFQIKVINESKCRYKTAYLIDYKHLNSLITMLNKLDLEPTIDENADINKLWLTWKYKFMRAVNTCIPKKKVKINNCNPWMKSEFKKVFRKQRRLHRRYKMNKNVSNKEKLKSHRKMVRKKLKSAEMYYIKHLSENIENGKKNFWKYVKRQQCNTVGINTLKYNGVNYVNDEEKANLLNYEFQSNFIKENRKNLPSLSSYNNVSEFTHIEITPNEVFTLLSQLDTSKATAPGCIMPKLLKSCACAIYPSLTKLFNESVKLCQIPDEWKDATITPLYKKGSKCEPKNYRPISLTSGICKILEKIMRKHLIKHLDSIKFLNTNQHGFRHKRSCETQLLATLEDWCNALEKKQNIDIVYLDISRAFDCVPHERLLCKLYNAGIKGNVLGWFKSFLQNRRQRVKINETYSNWVTVSSGIPQGTILGPVLFLVYINDIGKNLFSNIRLFADDCILYNCFDNCKNKKPLQDD